MTKILSLLIASFLVIATLGIVSAATTFAVSPTTVTFNKFDTSHTFTMSNADTSTPLNVDIGALPIINGVTLSTSGYTDGDDFNSTDVTLNLGTINWSSFNLGQTYSDTFLISDNATENVTMTVQIVNDNFCEYENDGNDLEVNIDQVDNIGLGDDDVWYPLDEIEFEIEVENKGNDDIDDVEVEWGLYDPSADEWIIEIQEEDEVDVDEDDKEVITFTLDLDKDLDIDEDDLDDGDYIFYVRATGTVDDSAETVTCASDSEEIEIIVEDDFVIADDIKLTGTTFCGSIVQLSADIYNIGSDDQDDVTVEIYSMLLGIDEVVDMGDIDSFDSKSLSLEFEIPQGIVEKTYQIKLEVYDDDNDLYEADDEEASFIIPVSVNGNCVVSPNADVLASLESGGKPGTELKIRASVTNTGSNQDTFDIEIADYSTWAELASVEPASVTLAGGVSRDVIIVFDVNSDATENQNFNIVLTDSNGVSLTQPVSVTIEQGFSLKGTFGDNAYIWAIALANIVLIAIIIFVAVKAMKR